jgi:drug/metabolite transporter (DMT)-like permease
LQFKPSQTKPLQKRTLAHLALIGTNFFFAINFTAVKYLINAGLVKPFGLNLIRISVTAALLWGMFFFKRQRIAIDRKDYRRFFLAALTGIAINQLLFIKGLSLTLPIHASLLMLTTPILITFIAAWLLKESINGFKIAGLALGITGAVILLKSGSSVIKADNIIWGDILVIINAISYTFYFILVRPLMKSYQPVMVIRMLFTIGFFMVLPFCWQDFQQTNWSSFTSKDFGILSLVVFGGTFLTYLFNVYGIKNLGASTAGSYIYVQPFFATLIAVLFYGEQLALYKMIAAVCILAGVFLVNKSTMRN